MQAVCALLQFSQFSCRFLPLVLAVFSARRALLPHRSLQPAIGENTMNIKQIFTALVSDESGQDLVEYALVVALIALGSVATMKALGTTINSLFTAVNTNLSTAVA